MFKKILVLLSVIIAVSTLFSCSNTNEGKRGDSSSSAISAASSDPGGEISGGDRLIVLFDSADGTAVEAQTVGRGEKAVRPSDPVRYGNEKKQYVFLGWYLGEEEYDFTTVVNDNFTLVAKWDEIVWSDDIGKR